MNFSLCARLALVALIVLAIGLKLGFRGLAEPESFDFSGRVPALLASNGFTSDHRIPATAQVNGIGGVNGACRLTIIDAAPQGHQEDSIRRMVGPGERAFFIFRGIRYDRQPRWQTMAHFYWTRLNRIWGRPVAKDPVFGVIASEGCDLATLNWLDRAAIR